MGLAETLPRMTADQLIAARAGGSVWATRSVGVPNGTIDLVVYEAASLIATAREALEGRMEFKARGGALEMGLTVALSAREVDRSAADAELRELLDHGEDHGVRVVVGVPRPRVMLQEEIREQAADPSVTVLAGHLAVPSGVASVVGSSAQALGEAHDALLARRAETGMPASPKLLCVLVAQDLDGLLEDPLNSLRLGELLTDGGDHGISVVMVEEGW
jgi:hypothetical protein